jgi:hypothetical protein
MKLNQPADGRAFSFEKAPQPGSPKVIQLKTNYNKAQDLVSAG